MTENIIKEKKIKKEDYTVYAIFHSKSKQYYIHFCKTAALRNSMKDHYTGRVPGTKAMFDEWKETIDAPEMHTLNRQIMSREECYDNKLIWIRYFAEKKYKCLNSKDDLSAAFELFEENQKRFDKIKGKRISDVITKENREFPNYGRERIENDDELTQKQINFRVLKSEYNTIKDNANKYGKTLSAYMKDTAINGAVITYNYDAIREHTDVINRLKTELYPVLTMLIQTKQAYPKDIDTIVELLQEISTTEKDLLQSTQRERNEVRKYIRKLVKQK